jgi:hypothetical protein
VLIPAWGGARPSSSSPSSSSTTIVRGSEDQQLQASYDHGPVQPAISGELTPLHHQKHLDSNCSIKFYFGGKATAFLSSLPSCSALFFRWVARLFWFGLGLLRSM